MFTAVKANTVMCYSEIKHYLKTKGLLVVQKSNHDGTFNRK